MCWCHFKNINENFVFVILKSNTPGLFTGVVYLSPPVFLFLSDNSQFENSRLVEILKNRPVLFSASSSVCDNKFSASETIYSALQASGIWLVRASSFMKYFPNLPETINILSILMRFLFLELSSPPIRISTVKLTRESSKEWSALRLPSLRSLVLSSGRALVRFLLVKV